MLKTLKALFLMLFLTHHCLTAGLADFKVDFNESMSTHGAHDLKYASNDPDWQLVEDLYNTNILNDLTYHQKPKIPKIVHHIWLGSNLPLYAIQYRLSWIKCNPGWTFVFWTDQPGNKFGDVTLNSFDELNQYLKNPNHKKYIVMNVKNVKLKNKRLYKEKARNWGEKSDILRYEILYNVGGLYVDTDFECLQSFDDLHHCLDFYTGVSDTKGFSVYNGLIASAKYSPIMHKAISTLKKNNHRYGSLGFSGPGHFTKCFLQSIRAHENDDLAVVAFPVTFFYPWPSKFKDDRIVDPESWIVPESYGLHYWKGAWDK